MSCAYLYVHNLLAVNVSGFRRGNLALLKKRQNGTAFNAEDAENAENGADWGERRNNAEPGPKGSYG